MMPSTIKLPDAGESATRNLRRREVSLLETSEIFEADLKFVLLTSDGISRPCLFVRRGHRTLSIHKCSYAVAFNHSIFRRFDRIGDFDLGKCYMRGVHLNLSRFSEWRTSAWPSSPTLALFTLCRAPRDQLGAGQPPLVLQRFSFPDHWTLASMCCDGCGRCHVRKGLFYCG